MLERHGAVILRFGKFGGKAISIPHTDQIQLLGKTKALGSHFSTVDVCDELFLRDGRTKTEFHLNR